MTKRKVRTPEEIAAKRAQACKYLPKNPPKPAKETLPIETLREYFRAEDDKLYWIKPFGKNQVGDRAGYLSMGYWLVHLMKRTYRVHRVLWALHYGSWPSSWIDHANGVATDNRLENLRLCTPSQNSINKKPFGALGVKGVSYLRGKYQVTVYRRYMGRFDSLEEAARVHDQEARRVYNEFARLNYPEKS